MSLFYNNKTITQIEKVVSKNIFLFFAILIIVLSILYGKGSPVVKKIDEGFSNRLFFSYKAIDKYGITIIGNDVKPFEVKIGDYYGKLISDVTYTVLLYKYGVFYIVLISLMARYISKNRTKKEYLLIIIYSVFAFFEVYSLNILISFPLIFASKYIKGEENDTKSN